MSGKKSSEKLHGTIEVPTFIAKNWGDAKAMVAGLGSGWVFRGQQKATWSLTSSLERSESVDRKGDERRLCWDFVRHAPAYLPSQLVPRDIAGAIAMMQHYGCPTRLVDFTRSPYVALFFALETANTRRCEHAVWAVNTGWCQERCAKSISAIENVSAEEALSRVLGGQSQVVDRLFQDLAFDAVLPVEPWLLDSRQAAQQTVLLCPCNLSSTFMKNLAAMGPVTADVLRKLVIPAHLRAEALDDLYRMNLTAAVLFPGLDGYARSLSMTLSRERPELKALRMAILGRSWTPLDQPADGEPVK